MGKFKKSKPSETTTKKTVWSSKDKNNVKKFKKSKTRGKIKHKRGKVSMKPNSTYHVNGKMKKINLKTNYNQQINPSTEKKNTFPGSSEKKNRFSPRTQVKKKHLNESFKHKKTISKFRRNKVQDKKNDVQFNKKLRIIQYVNQQMSENKSIEDDHMSYQQKKNREKLKQKIKETLYADTTNVVLSKRKQPEKSLRTRMLEKLQAARFRYINEQIYSADSKETQKLFLNDPESFSAYHEGYRQQVNKWPINPLDVIIESIQKLPNTLIIADLGCGDAKLAQSVEQKVYSFDLVSKSELVTACDMAHVPLQKNSVDVVVFCLSLMGTNLHDYILEANRILKQGGTLKIAEVESRIECIKKFIDTLSKYHFTLTWHDLSHNLFYFLDFKKESNIKNKKRLPVIHLNPCLYKKR